MMDLSTFDPSARSAVDFLSRAERVGHADAETWHRFLDATGTPDFLEALPDRETRDRWANVAFRAIRESGYSLRTMLERRAAAHPDRILFEDARDDDTPLWSYAAVLQYSREIAGVFLGAVREPRVAIFCENNVDGAVADLACLTNAILVAPVNVHSDPATLASIVSRLDVNVVVTDSDERQARITQAAAQSGRELVVFRCGSRASGEANLRLACARADLQAQDALLASRAIDLVAPATVMFTSGSTGESKGLVFSQLMLVAKRFARAAALPSVGRDEVLLCYLPLFHTFGRYLEMLGTIFWGGTYVFAGNPSAEALMTELARVQPTGLISIPLRWSQIRDHCLERGDGENGFRAVVGDRLRWGLSAAGYLDPRVFRFFHRHGVELCSGFGMTEATGGITMTPPGEYVDGSVGRPLPGIETRLSEQGELQISGIYVAPYLETTNAGEAASFPSLDPDVERWMPTGDLFQRLPNGHLQIVDRIKDIYKNSRGQTIAPQRIEQQFAGVPGIRRTFLAGDHRDHNVLLIVPDRTERVIARKPEKVHDYFAQIVATVNSGLAAYERVVNFALVDRDFDAAHGELTAKGSFRRKTIEANFAEVIERLYQSKFVELRTGRYRVRIPRWIFRDLGIIEDDVAATRGGLRNRRSGLTLAIRAGDDGRVRIGDLEYTLVPTGATIDLGLFARQPRLWLGNPQLAAFLPCKSGWEHAITAVSETVRLPRRASRTTPAAPRIDEDRLRELHRVTCEALFGITAESRAAVQQLGEELERASAPVGAAIQHRLEALAWRPEEEIRALAYRTLLLDSPVVDDDRVFASFLDSDRSFLDQESIAAIAAAKPAERRLQSLRQRLYGYRTRLAWPGPPSRRRQFSRVLRLLTEYARHDASDFAVVQAELAAWALFDGDPQLARTAAQQFDELTAWYDSTLRPGVAKEPLPATASRIVFDYSIGPSERAALSKIVFDSTFLRHSIASAFGESDFSWDHVTNEGVWVSSLLSHHQLRLYRLGINLSDGRHFDLLLAAGAPLRSGRVKETILWMAALSGHAFSSPALPRFGAWRKDLGAMTVAYVSDLTAWDRIRGVSSQFDDVRGVPSRRRFRALYVRSMAAFFRAWEQSGYRILPGALTPANVAVPDADFHERASILSLAGWRRYEGPLSLVRPMVRSFYRLTAAHYPPARELLSLEWMFDAAVEALGEPNALRFLDELHESLASAATSPEMRELAASLDEWRERLGQKPYVPLAVLAAVERYREWERLNPGASSGAREETVVQMMQLYRLSRFPDAYRYFVYRDTYFARRADLAESFDRLIERRLRERAALAGHLEELRAVQSLLDDPDDRAVFSRMVFPRAARSQRVELTSAGGDGRRVLVRSELRDDAGNRYTVRGPASAAEVGQLYRLFAETDFPMEIAEEDRQLLIVDPEERVVGGLCYRWLEKTLVYVDGVVVSRALVHRGIGGRLLEDFCVRMAAEGARLLRTNFFLGGLFTKHGFEVNARWGGLVREL